MIKNINDMLHQIEQYNPNADFVMLKKAFQKCKQWHGTQKRKSGEPYYTHPFAVANEIIKIQLDDTTIITALLHDVLEDTNITFKDIESEFSLEIAELVDGVTKLDKINFQLDQIKQAENFRKLFLALAKDIRVLIVKLYDRLHNMQTIGYKNSPSIKRIAVETLEIYAPLAERIGMHDLNKELQDLSFGAINSRARNAVIRRLEQIKSKSENGDLVNNVTDELKTLLNKANIECTVKGREKSPYSVWTKLMKKGTTFEKLIDIVGFRVIVQNQEDCYKALGAIHSNYKAIPNTFSDYISLPKINGYQSIHTVIIGPFLQRIEIQIRTKDMDIESEYGLAAHWSYKQNVSTKPHRTTKGMELWIKTILDILKGTNNAEEFLETTKLEMYTEQIFAFTPEGDIVDLPSGATVLDFAFAIHSDVGCFCDSAKVNNIKVTKNTKIKNGDQVKIITSKCTWPTLDWLDMVITGKARHAIKKATKEEQTAVIIAKGKEILSKLFAQYNHKIDDNIINKLINVTNSLNANILYKNIASNIIDIVGIVKKTFPNILYVGNAFLQMNSFDGINESKNIIKIYEKPEKWIINYKIDNLPSCFLHKLSFCCKPTIGDSVIGISIPNDAIFIHKNSCENISDCYLNDYTVINNLHIVSN